MNKKKVIPYVVLAICTIVFMVGVWVRIGMESSSRIVFLNGGGNLGNYHKGDVIMQELPIKCNGIKVLSISFATFGKTDNTGQMSIVVKDIDGKTLGESVIDISEVGDCSYQSVRLSESPAKGEKVSVIIEINELGEGSELTSFITNGDSQTHNLTINGEIKPYEIHILADTESHLAYSILAVTMILILAIVIGIVLHLALENKVVFHKIFLVISIGMGIVYMIMIPVRTVPDEDAHIVTAYNISNKILGTDELSVNGKIYMRYCDAHASYRDRPRDEEMVDLLGEYFSLPNKEQTVMVETTYGSGVLNEPAESYVLSALGITIGRILNLSGAMTLLLGRIFNYILYVAITYFSIKKIPFGKLTLLLITMLPMVLQQVMSYSYDSLTMAAIILFASYFCSLMQGEVVFSKKEFVILLLDCLIISRIKNSAYIPLLFMLLIPIFRYRKEPGKKKLVQMLWVIVFAFIVFKVLNVVLDNLLVETVVGTVQNNYYTLEFLLAHPKKLMLIIVNTVTQKFDFYLYSMMGYSLSHFDIYMPSFVAVIYLFLLFVSLIMKEGETAVVTIKERWFSVFWSLVSAGGIVYALLVGFTQMGNMRVEGVQGRYFLPQLVVLLPMLRIGCIRLKKDLAGGLIVGALVLQSFTIYSIIEYYLLR